jgi:two-component system response regulator YesN
MYSVAIADDETNIREGLRDLVNWNGLGFALAGTFDNGEGLLSLVEKSPPDLIVTDIMMNRCTGLDISQHIKKYRLSTRVVLISGYKEADLAMSAIKYGVKDYILKPIDLDELTDCIQRVREELDAQRVTQLQQAELCHARSEISDLLGLFFEELMLGSLQNQASVKRMFSLLYPDLPFEQSACFSLVLRTRQYDSFIRNQPVRSRTELPEEISGFSAMTGGGVEFRLISQREDGLLLFGLLRFQTAGPVRDAVAQDVEALCDALRADFSMRTEVDSLETFASIPAMMKGIARAGQGDLAGALEQLHRQQEDFYAVLREGDDIGVARAVDTFSAYLGGMELPTALEMARNLLYTVSAKLRADVLSPAAALALDSAFDRLDAAADHTALRKVLAGTFEELCVALQDGQNGIVERAKAYILGHIGEEDITLQDIADHFYLSQYHFSRTFKAKAGETFIRFVIRCKMDYAAQLLADTDLKIYDVCERTGYKSLRHFTKLFKAHTGMQPSAYRQRMHIEGTRDEK